MGVLFLMKNVNKIFRFNRKKACVFRIDAILLVCKWRKVVISGLKWSKSGSIPRSYKMKEIF